MLSATDSCRDRLAAAFHWRDAAAMRAAVEIALRNEVDFHTIKRWSESERSLDRYEAFLEGVKKSKKRRRARGRTR
jgi:hypothetical protein